MLETEIVFEEMANRKLKIAIGGGGANIKIWPEIIADVFGRDISFLDDIYPKKNTNESRTYKFDKKNHKIYQEKFNNFRSCYKEISSWFKSQES